MTDPSIKKGKAPTKKAAAAPKATEKVASAKVIRKGR